MNKVHVMALFIVFKSNKLLELLILSTIPCLSAKDNHYEILFHLGDVFKG